MTAKALTPEESRLISEGFALKIASTAPVRKVLRAETSQGPVMIKALTVSEAEARFLEAALRSVRERGLKEVPPYLTGKEGHPFVRSGNVIYVAMPWFEGRECSFSDIADARDAAGLLGRFHTAARGFSPLPWLPRSRAIPGRWVRKLLTRAGQVASFARQVLERPGSIPKDVHEASRRALTRAGWVTNALRSPTCHRMILKAGLEGTLAHGDYSQINVIRCNNGSLGIVDWDGLSYEIQLADLYKMVRQCEWNIDVAAPVIDAYRETAGCDRETLEFLAEALAFPKLYWSWSRSASLDPGLIWRPDALLPVLDDMEKQDRFLTDFSIHIAPLPRFKEGSL